MEEEEGRAGENVLASSPSPGFFFSRAGKYGRWGVGRGVQEMNQVLLPRATNHGQNCKQKKNEEDNLSSRKWITYPGSVREKALRSCQKTSSAIFSAVGGGGVEWKIWDYAEKLGRVARWREKHKTLHTLAQLVKA